MQHVKRLERASLHLVGANVVRRSAANTWRSAKFGACCEPAKLHAIATSLFTRRKRLAHLEARHAAHLVALSRRQRERLQGNTLSTSPFNVMSIQESLVAGNPLLVDARRLRVIPKLVVFPPRVEKHGTVGI